MKNDEFITLKPYVDFGDLEDPRTIKMRERYDEDTDDTDHVWNDIGLLNNDDPGESVAGIGDSGNLDRISQGSTGSVAPSETSNNCYRVGPEGQIKGQAC